MIRAQARERLRWLHGRQNIVSISKGIQVELEGVIKSRYLQSRASSDPLEVSNVLDLRANLGYREQIYASHRVHKASPRKNCIFKPLQIGYPHRNRAKSHLFMRGKQGIVFFESVDRSRGAKNEGSLGPLLWS